MARTVGIGIQDYGKIIENNCFYVDKTSFIKEWWESRDEVTLITRPRRFGKTLTMSMVEHFFLSNMLGDMIFLRVCLSGRRNITVDCRELIRSSAFHLPL